MPKKILFVDDEPDWRQIPIIFLKDAGYEVLTAKDPADAVAQAKNAKLDLIILDVNLAGQSGVDLLKVLKKDHATVPFILYTGMEHDDQTVQTMLQAGADLYLRKTTMEEMLRAVQNILDRHSRAPHA
ncbi:MAG TPA: response regulator [Candidatus Binatia bacterium]|jgi:DNA-binding response OmpR family regulator|nr:response regulator [Candidatus Binatia bacterium]